MIKKIIKTALSRIPLRKLIVFESIPNLSDNPQAVFNEMLRRNLNETYRFVWIVRGKDGSLPKIKHVTYCDKDSKFYKFKLLYYRIFAKALISCNDFLVTLRKGQTSFYLTHGTAIKSVRNYYNVPDNIDYTLIDGEATKQIMSYELNVPSEKVVALGYPRNDILVNAGRDLHSLFPGHEQDKIVVWYPTFRQHKNGMQHLQSYALPILHDEEQAKKLNKIAKDNGVLIILKPHFAQDVSQIKACHLSHIHFIEDSFFVANNLTSYEFIAGCDALLTDYSSVYYDYLLCDKPIGLVWEDYETYKSTVHFAVDMEYYMKAGEKIYSLSDFELFLKNLTLGNDTLKNQRAEICSWANFAKDGKSAERVTDFILEKAGI